MLASSAALGQLIDVSREAEQRPFDGKWALTGTGMYLLLGGQDAVVYALIIQKSPSVFTLVQPTIILDI